MIKHVAPLHAELLFIHPFRDGNGCTIRLFADLIALKSGFDRFNFEKITEKRMPGYISATEKNYEPLIKLFRSFKK
ncbi:Fic family protein [Rhodohalobacter sp. 8-1]|uniref:Fic family protein n=1 Tax=Rhodohalobacter sp. 8-1 TaxID=3131972 RepID=UPI00403EFE53